MTEKSTDHDNDDCNDDYNSNAQKKNTFLTDTFH